MLDQTKKNNQKSISSSYTFTVSKYRANTVVEELLLLGLSHTTAESANKRTEWAYKNNPAGAALVCIMRHSESDKDVGLVTLCKRQVWSRCGILDAAILCDLVIDKSHRTLGPAIKLIENVVAGADQAKLDRTYGWPSERSVVLYKRVPKSQMCQIDIYRRYFDWRAEFDVRLPKPLAIIAGAIVGLIDSSAYAAKKIFRSRKFNAQHPDHFSSAFDDLWVVAREQYDEIGFRDATFLNWRFKEIPDHGHKIFTLNSKTGNRVSGYVVYREREGNVVEISDFLANSNDFSERYLIDHFCAYLRDIGIKKISLLFTGNTNTVRNIKWCGFIKVGSRPSNRRQLETSALSAEFARTHITQADQDVG